MEERKGYLVIYCDGSEFYMPKAMHIERDDELMIYDDDTEAALAAERDGIALIHGMEYVPDGVYLDTPENREIILDMLEKYPEYKTVEERFPLIEPDLSL